jgi:hypothetical protein
MIKGYGPVKEASVRRWREQAASIQAQAGQLKESVLCPGESWSCRRAR